MSISLLETPLAGEVRGDSLEIGRRIAGQVARDVALRRLEPGLRRIVDEQPPDLLERDAADEILDVDTAIAERSAVAVWLGNLGFEGDNTLEALA